MSRKRRVSQAGRSMPIGRTADAERPELHFIDDARSIADLLEFISRQLAGEPACTLTARSIAAHWIAGAKQVEFAIVASIGDTFLTAAGTTVLATAEARLADGTPRRLGLVELDGCSVDWQRSVSLRNGSVVRGVTFGSARHALQFSEVEQKIIAATANRFLPRIGPISNRIGLNLIEQALLGSEAFKGPDAVSRETIRKTLLKAGLWKENRD